MRRVMFFLACILSICGCTLKCYAKVYFVEESSQAIYTPSSFSSAPGAGDTIKISFLRTTRLQFSGFHGDAINPIVFINTGGRVQIKCVDYQPALKFQNCEFIKITGKGDNRYYYGFNLIGPSFGLSFEELCSNCEAEFIQVDSCSVGIHAKKDYGGNPPVPYPVFKNLALHDNFLNYCIEPMYIGETKSPGMEFRHVRIYNNVVLNSRRESFQIANCVEDVSVYNNFCYVSGLDYTPGQTNNSQLGGNSVGRFFNNVFIDAPNMGVIVFGKGDMYIKNNYLERNKGVFADDRYYPILDSPLSINHNYFRNCNGNQILYLMNEYNDIYCSGNRYNTNIPFLNRSKSLPALIQNDSNRLDSVKALKYVLNNGVFALADDCPLEYRGMGPIQGLGHRFNYTPVLDSIPDLIVNIGDTLSVQINATVEDNDRLSFSAKSLPDFVSIKHVANGQAIIHIDGRERSKCVYYSTICVADSSDQAMFRQKIKIAIRDSLNSPVSMSISDPIYVEAASKSVYEIPAIDADNDSIRYTISNQPYFVDFVSTKDHAFFKINPTYINPGVYPIIIKAEDGYSKAVIDTLILNVYKPILSQGRLLYRVRYGSKEIEDTPINWQKDYSDYRSYEANYSMGTGSEIWNGRNMTNAPNNIFGQFRYNGVSMSDMIFKFPCEPGKYQVNLFFVQRSNEVINNTVETFSVYEKDSLKLDSINLYNEAGYSAIKKTFNVYVRDNIIELRFRKLINNAKINAIEIVYLDKINLAPVISQISNLIVNEGDSVSIPLNVTDDRYNLSDSLIVSVEGPPFVSVSKSTQGYYLRMNPDFNSSGSYNISLLASDGSLSTSSNISLIVKEFHVNPPVLNSISKNTVTAGIKDTISIVFSDPDNDSFSISKINGPDFVQLHDCGSGKAYVILNPTYSDAGDYRMDIKATDSYGIQSDTSIVFSVLPGNEIVRIPLNISMITDQVPGGSNPGYYVDEQGLDPFLNQHPISNSWRAITQYLPCSFYINLGNKYVLKKILLHDMNNAGNLLISTGVPDGWSDLMTLYTNQYKAWRSFNIDVVTQYIKFSILDNLDPQINEIALYGYLEPTTLLRSASLNTSQIPDSSVDDPSVNLTIYPNPVRNRLNIICQDDYVLVSVRSMIGNLVMSVTEKTLDLTSLESGMYVVSVWNKKHELIGRKTFVKN